MLRCFSLPVFALLLGACAGMSSHAAEPTLDDIVSRHVAARGGASSLDAIQSQRIDVEIVEGSMQLFGRYAAHIDGRVRIDIYHEGKRVFSEGIDASGAWSREGDAVAKASALAAAHNALAHSAEDHMFGWHRFAERGNPMRLMPSERIDGAAHPVVEVRYRTGHVSYFTLDPQTAMVVRKRDERAYHPDVDRKEKLIETRYGRFTTEGGVRFSSENSDWDLRAGTVLATNRVVRRLLNPALCAVYFDRDRLGPARPDDPDGC